MKSRSLFLGLFTGCAFTASAVDFEKEIKPLFEANCVSCHKEGNAEADLIMTTREAILKGSVNGHVLTPEDPDDSVLYTMTILDEDDDELMPPKDKGGPLPWEHTELISEWIAEGAPWPEGVKLEQRQRVDFVKDIQPILEYNCVSCHMSGNAEGGYRLDQMDEALDSGDNAPNLIPFDAENSALYFLTAVPEDDVSLMPPKDKGGPLPQEEIDLLRMWVEQGAPWPDGVALVARKKVEEDLEGDLANVQRIHEMIMANDPIDSESAMEPYSITIPGSDATFEMVPIPSGEFQLGSPDTESGRQADEGPQVNVKIDPFWMGKYEVTWNEFELFMYPHQEQRIRNLKQLDPSVSEVPDAQARPTAPYVEMSFGMGKDGYPAISMTQHAASKFCQWLSAKTGQFYRLPTEAEWEYACRAGTTSAWSFGDDPEEIGDYAWYGMNSDWKYQKVGTKKPNPWGLYDMHGNVAEWVLDQYDANFYRNYINTGADNPWNPGRTLYPRVVRGGSWDDDDPLALRSAVRRASGPEWKRQDPQLPKSIWYLTDAQFVGFRVVRPLEVPSPEEMEAYWNSAAGLREQ